MTEISLRLGMQQRVLPNYRVPFFEALAAACSKGISLFAGKPRAEESIECAAEIKGAHFFQAANLHFFSGSAYLCWQMGLLKWLQSWQPRVLIMEANPRYLSSPQAIRWMHNRHRPVIGWGLGAPASRSGLAAVSRRHFLAKFDAVIAYSAKGAEEYRNACVDPERVFIAPNAVSPRPVGPPPDRPAQEAKQRLTVLSVGRLQARKRIDHLIRACAKLPDELQPELLIVGDGPEREPLEALAQSTYPRAQFLGARHESELEPIYSQADLFVLPGTGGLAVQQAMAHALPVIVAEADGTQADLVRSENGWIVPPGEIEAMTERLADALRDLPRLRHMGNASYHIVDQEINTEKMVEVFAKAIQAACATYNCTIR